MSIMNITPSPKANAIFKSVCFVSVFIIFLFAGSQLLLLLPKFIPMFYYGLFGTLSAFLTLVIFLKIDRTSFKAIGLNWSAITAPNLGVGILLGTLLFLGMLSALVTIGGLTIQAVPNKPIGDIVLALLPLILLVLMEELAFRSYPLWKLQKVIGIWAAQLIIALLFAVYHILNGWNIYIALMGPMIWSFVFGIAAIWSKGIAMPVGIHLSLNIGQTLAGMKGSNGAIFKVAYVEGASQTERVFTEHVGLGLHVLVLLFSCFLTWKYSKRERS